MVIGVIKVSLFITPCIPGRGRQAWSTALDRGSSLNRAQNQVLKGNAKIRRPIGVRGFESLPLHSLLFLKKIITLEFRRNQIIFVV